MPASSTIGIQEILYFISADGQQQIIEFVRRAQDERGSSWLAEIQTEYPMMSFLVELVANRDAPTAYAELQTKFRGYPLWLAKDQLISLHGRLRAEIDKPRG